MKILVVGNGFDLAHKLPTSYWNCLNFLSVAYECKQDFSNWRPMLWRNPNRKVGLDERLLDFSNYQIDFLKEFSAQINDSSIKYLSSNANVTLNTLLLECISDNVWLEYFWEIQKSNHQRGKKWVDFESEISRIIQIIDNRIKEGEHNGVSLHSVERKFFSDLNFVKQPQLKILEEKLQKFIDENFNAYSTNEEIKVGIIDMLYENLLRLTTAIEIYLKTCVLDTSRMKLPCFIKIGLFDKVISFNYTNTFTLYMKSASQDNICYIHGSIRSELNNIHTPLVLGIDEYLDKDTRDRDIDWVMFKKFFQRIYRRSDYKYKGWSEFSFSGNVKTQPIESYIIGHSVVELYIIGHSLDVTDRDVLRDLILRENQITKIFYRNSTQLARELKNLIRLIGSEELNKRCRSVPPSIVFIEQESSFDPPSL